MIDRYAAFTSAVSAIYKAVQKLERQETERYGLQGPHVQCLLEAGRHPEGIFAAQLAELCEKDKASVSRSLSALEKKGLLSREPGYRGRVKLTETGKAVTYQLTCTAGAIVEAVSLDFEEAERAAFYKQLEQIADRLQNLSAKGAEQ